MPERQPTFDRTPVATGEQQLEELYDERRKSLEGLPQTQLAPEELTRDRMPNIFTGRNIPTIWKQHDDGVPCMQSRAKQTLVVSGATLK